ncbi:hypothetical protein CI238_07057 [Colletotrichum incanum]|uniref:Uncharacterized protein n=1 Tax=Colletotrichum incanum TaxID=1573173 RepID=A0A166ZGG9_COLIC|nr:hypothetical protein CI238_07057 [Colletotrichum incanum]OHW94868.1 hypothetical protein CSPAE12_06464 [Colletotrichum incanum]
MQLPTLAPLVVTLILLTSGAQAGKKKQPNPWLVHRLAMEQWIRWPHNETRGLRLTTLPACIQRCVTPERAVLDIHGQKADARTINRRVFCDPRLNLINVFFIHTIGPCTLESCRFEHALEALRGHYRRWLVELCRPPNIPRRRYKKPGMGMTDPSADNTDAYTDNDTDDDEEEYADEDIQVDAHVDANDDVDTADAPATTITANAITNV